MPRRWSVLARWTSRGRIHSSSLESATKGKRPTTFISPPPRLGRGRLSGPRNIGHCRRREGCVAVARIHYRDDRTGRARRVENHAERRREVGRYVLFQIENLDGGRQRGLQETEGACEVVDAHTT